MARTDAKATNAGIMADRKTRGERAFVASGSFVYLAGPLSTYWKHVEKRMIEDGVGTVSSSET